MNERPDLPDADHDRIDPPLPEVDVASVEGIPSSGSPEHALTEPQEFPVPTPLVVEARCLNCDHMITGKYCANCAQRADTHRMSWRWLVHEVQHGWFHLDKGILYTAKAMLVRPGPAIREYLDGRRKRYFPPFTFLLLLVGLSSLVQHMISSRVSDHLSETVTLEGQEVQMFQWFFDHQSAVLLAFTPVFALASYVMLQRYGRTLVEFVIACAFIGGQGLLIELLLLPLTPVVLGSDIGVGNVSIGIRAGMFISTMVGLHRPHAAWRVGTRAFLALFLTGVIGIVVAVIGVAVWNQGAPL
ncbi:MAG: DUF3667 domain-containing protein [Flavobacteriales bacterium]|nr:DUF3667 domain-containing protein [Flavobacteriales bacterium]